MKLCPICHGDVEAVGSFTACTCTVASLRSAAVGFRTKMDEANSSHHDALEQVETLTAECAKMRAEVTDLLLKRDVRLESERNAISAAIGTCEFMDPPDGGSPTLAEQVSRMRKALDESRDHIDALVAVANAKAAANQMLATIAEDRRLECERMAAELAKATASLSDAVSTIQEREAESRKLAQECDQIEIERDALAAALHKLCDSWNEEDYEIDPSAIRHFRDARALLGEKGGGK